MAHFLPPPSQRNVLAMKQRYVRPAIETMGAVGDLTQARIIKPGKPDGFYFDLTAGKKVQGTGSNPLTELDLFS